MLWFGLGLKPNYVNGQSASRFVAHFKVVKSDTKITITLLSQRFGLSQWYILYCYTHWLHLSLTLCYAEKGSHFCRFKMEKNGSNSEIDNNCILACHFKSYFLIETFYYNTIIEKNVFFKWIWHFESHT